MTLFTKTLISSLLASVLVISAPVNAQNIFIEETMPDQQREIELDERTSGDVERSIVINAKQGKTTRVVVDEDGQQYRFNLTDQDIADMKVLNQKLDVLSGETLIKVRSALQSVNKNMVRMRDSGMLNSIVVELDGDEVNTDIDFDFSAIENIKDLADLKSLEALGELKELKVLEQLMSKEHAKVIRERIRHDHHSEREERVSERREQLMEQKHREHERQMVKAEKKHRVHQDRMHRQHRQHQRVIIVDGEDSNIVYDVNNSSVSNHQGDVKRFKLTSDNMVLKGHVDAILKLISHGEFTPDELDKLQQMLDSKR